jgi:hypothetical protein
MPTNFIITDWVGDKSIRTYQQLPLTGHLVQRPAMSVVRKGSEMTAFKNVISNGFLGRPDGSIGTVYETRYICSSMGPLLDRSKNQNGLPTSF